MNTFTIPYCKNEAEFKSKCKELELLFTEDFPLEIQKKNGHDWVVAIQPQPSRIPSRLRRISHHQKIETICQFVVQFFNFYTDKSHHYGYSGYLLTYLAELWSDRPEGERIEELLDKLDLNFTRARKKLALQKESFTQVENNLLDQKRAKVKKEESFNTSYHSSTVKSLDKLVQQANQQKKTMLAQEVNLVKRLQTVGSEAFSAMASDHKQKALGLLRKSESSADCYIECYDGLVKAHRLMLLRSGLPFLQKVLVEPPKSNDNYKIYHLDLTKFPAKTVNDFLDYLYFEQFSLKSAEQILHLCSLAQHLGFSTLYEKGKKKLSLLLYENFKACLEILLIYGKFSTSYRLKVLEEFLFHEFIERYIFLDPPYNEDLKTYLKANEVQQQEFFQFCSSSQSPQAIFLLMRCFEKGIGVEANEKTARQLFSKLKQQHSAAAGCYIGFCYQYGILCQKNLPLAFEYYSIAARDTFLPAVVFQGLFYLNGWGGIGKEGGKAEAQFYQAHQAGYMPGKHQLSLVYKNRPNTLANQKTLTELLEKNAKKNYPPSIHELALSNHQKNTKDKILALYKQAADLEYTESQNSLGEFFKSINNLDAANELFFKAAEKKHAKAQYNYACYLLEKRHEGKYDKEAFELFSLSAVQGYDEAQLKLGECYSSGIGVLPDQDLAFESFFNAALQKNYEAVQKVIDAYQNGKGTTLNQAQATEWSKKTKESRLKRILSTL